MRLGMLLALLLALLPTAAHAQWREATSQQFIVYSTISEPRLKRYAETLERYDSLLRVLSGKPSSPVGDANRITVYLVENMAEIRALAGQSYVAGFYIPRAGGSVAFAPAFGSGSGRQQDLNPQNILLHEYAHHYMLLNLPAAYPAWFVEGYAEFHGATTFDKDGAAMLGNGAMHRGYALSRSAVPISRLLNDDRPVSTTF